MPHRIRAAGVMIPLDPPGEYDDPGFTPNQTQKQATGAVTSWTSGLPTPAPARLKLRVAVSSATPQGCEDEVERWTAIFRRAERFYDEFSTRCLLIAGLPTLTFDRRKGRATKHIAADWPLLDPYWHSEDGNGNLIPGSTRLSP
jgi:hypothetical protein